MSVETSKEAIMKKRKQMGVIFFFTQGGCGGEGVGTYDHHDDAPHYTIHSSGV